MKKTKLDVFELFVLTASVIFFIGFMTGLAHAQLSSFSDVKLVGTTGTGISKQVQIETLQTLDLSNPFADPRLGIALNLKGESRTVAYVPAVYFMPGGIEYATFNFGVTNDNETGTKKLLLSVGPRIDTGIDRLSEVPWVKKNFKFIKLPPLQISPTIMTSDFRVYTWWVTLASKFGGK